MQVRTHSATQTQSFAYYLAQHVPMGQVIRLEGPLGSGKTTFTQGFGRGLGIKRAIKSPTYTIVKNYPLSAGEFVHIDAYRLEDGGAETVDIDLFLRADTVALIEWGQFIEEFLPEQYIAITFDLQDTFEDRVMTIDYHGGTVEQQAWLETILSNWEGK